MRRMPCSCAFLVLLAGVALPSCYSKSADAPHPPDRFADGDGDGAPDRIGPDPELSGRYDGSPADDYDADGIPDDVDVDDDNDGVLDASPDRDLVDAVRPLARATCEAVSECCDEGWSETSLANCTLDTTGSLVVALAQSWSDGYLRVDPAGLSDCETAQRFDCQFAAWRQMPFSCSTYLVGLQPDRAFCDHSADCDAGRYCAAEFLRPDPFWVSGPGPYRVRGWRGFYKVTDEDVCLEGAAAGEVCDSESGPPCAAGLDCRGDGGAARCVQPVAAGVACTVFDALRAFDDCPADQFCLTDESATHCELKRHGGESCLESRECLSDACDVRTETCRDVVPFAPACDEGRSFE